MKYTSAEANKLLKKLQEELTTVVEVEDRGKEFLAAVGEDAESVRPDYDFTAVQKQKDGLEEKIRKVKHAINSFNVTTVIPELKITVDQALVLIPQLTQRKALLADMVRKLPKEREQLAGRTNVIDYRYLNYDLKTVAKEYERVSDLLTKAQTALDNVNGTLTLEIKF